MKSGLNIALMAHVDAGKTSITEQILHFSGEIKKAGMVDKGDTVSDVLSVEKSRGISVLASQMKYVFQNRKINIIDTPGHADFISEVERSLMAVDLVLLIVSAYEGVQSQTRNIWKVLKRNQIPCLLVVNKMDKDDFFKEDVLKNIRNELSDNCVAIQDVNGSDINTLKKVGFDYFDDLKEKIIEKDEVLMESFFAEELISEELIHRQYVKSWKEAELFPVVFTSAKQAVGIEELLLELNEFPTSFDSTADFSALVYKLTHDAVLGKLSHIKVLSGNLNKKQLVQNIRLNEEEKVNQLKQIFSNKSKDVDQAFAGDIVAVSGFNRAEIGDLLGAQTAEKALEFQSVSVLNTQIKALNVQDYVALSQALIQLNREDPNLDFVWYREEEEFQLKVNGKIQMEILEQLILDRFGIEVAFGEPQVIYKESPLKSAFGYDAYTMPKPCWAVVKFLIEPGELGSGVSYRSEIKVNDVLQKYQNEVERTIPKALEQGMKGWEVTDIKVTFIEGEDHVIHSRPGDFVIATPMAMMDALQNAGSQLLEPVLKYRIEAPESALGNITSEILSMRGRFNQPEFFEEVFLMEAFIPVASSMDFPVYLAAQTAGQAMVSTSFYAYEKVEDEFAEIRTFKGISPLDRSKYILKARKAIQ